MKNLDGSSIRILTTGAALVVAVAVSACDSRPGLQLTHRLQSALKPHTAVATIDVDGVGPIRLFLDPRDDVMTPYLWSGRVWEATETHWFIDSLRAGDVVVDAGANLGYYTIIGAKLVGDSGRVYAFEPDPTSFGLLQRNIRLNGVRNVVLEPKALSNENGTLELFIADKNKGDHRIYQPEGEHRESVTVEAVTLDSYFADPDRSVDFVKVDTQGAEYLILQGARDLVRRAEDLVMAFEYSPWNLAGLGHSGRQLLDEIDSHQLRIYNLGLGGESVSPIRPIGVAELERRFNAKSQWFTNLLLVKGRQDLTADLDSAPGEPTAR